MPTDEIKDAKEVTEVKDANFATGAVRSADCDELDFASAPLIGLLGVMKVAGSGGIKYGRFNYAQGIPVHVTLNHVAVHLIRYLLGDRSEDHLSKVAWGAMVANQTALLQPELATPFMLGPGATLSAELLATLADGKPERDRLRQAGAFEDLFRDGGLATIPQVVELLKAREAQGARGENSTKDGEPETKRAILTASDHEGSP